jgi:L-ribulose-5-phosphate 3-epimerase UlaE
VEFIFPELTFGNTAERRLTLDWSDLRIYDINEKGGNHGILLGTMGWAPMQ